MIRVFQSDVDPSIFAFTRDAQGENLPNRFAPWRMSNQSGSVYFGAGESSMQVGSADPVIRAVDTKGFYLVASTPRPRTHRYW